MAGRKHRVIRRREVAVEPEIEADDEVEDDDEVEEEELDDEEEEEEEEEEETPAPVRKAKVPAPKPAPVKAVPAPAPKPVAKKAPAPLPEDDEEEEKTPAAPVKIKGANAMVVDGLLAGAMTALADGKSLVITALGDNKYSIVMGEAAAKPTKKLRGAEYAQEVLSPEYIKWMSEWKLKTYDEKVAFAKKIKVTCEAHTTPQINVMRVTDAVRTKLGLEKYKEQYRSRSARAALLG